MNYRRGFRRLYLVLTVAWIVWVFWFTHPEDWRLFWPFPSTGIPSGTPRWEIIVAEWSPALLPPLFGFILLYPVLFYVVPWISRGFRPGTRI